MARKGKDLFVILAERQKRAENGRSAPRKEATKASRSGGSTKASAATAAASGAGALGAKVGGWVSGAVRSMRGDDNGGSRRQTRSSEPRSVPRGLLIPGWLLAAMLVVSLGGGFGIGRMLGSGDTPQEIEMRKDQAAHKPGAFDPSPAELTAAEETAELSDLFFVVKTYLPGKGGRAAAAKLARELRQNGVADARIRAFHKNGSLFAWATLCYVASFAEEDRVLKSLQRLEGDLGFSVVPGLKQL